MLVFTALWEGRKGIEILWLLVGSEIPCSTPLMDCKSLKGTAVCYLS